MQRSVCSAALIHDSIWFCACLRVLYNRCVLSRKRNRVYLHTRLPNCQNTSKLLQLISVEMLSNAVNTGVFRRSCFKTPPIWGHVCAFAFIYIENNTQNTHIHSQTRAGGSFPMLFINNLFVAAASVFAQGGRLATFVIAIHYTRNVYKRNNDQYKEKETNRQTGDCMRRKSN
jgi:hypothetical protein